MKTLKKDIYFILALLVSNMVIQVTYADSVNIVFKAMYEITLIASILFITYLNKVDMKDKANLVVMIYTAVLVISTTILGLTGSMDITDISYGIIWVVTIASYILSLSHPVVSMLLLNISQLSAVITQIVGGSSVDESFKSVGGLWIVAFIALLFQIILANKKIEKTSNIKDKIINILKYERHTVKVNVLTHLVVWSLVITCVSYMARTELYEVMSSDIGYALFAAASIMITTFLLLSAVSTTVMIVEMFAVYTLLEWYTISYLAFIDNGGLYKELSTVIIDTAILIYMISKYRGQLKEHSIQKEVSRKDNS